jgi:hypothetical protein
MILLNGDGFFFSQCKILPKKWRKKNDGLPLMTPVSTYLLVVSVQYTYFCDSFNDVVEGHSIDEEETILN